MGTSPEHVRLLKKETLQFFQDLPTRLIGMTETCAIVVTTEPRTKGDAYFLSSAGIDRASSEWASQLRQGAPLAEQCRAALAADEHHRHVGASCAAVTLT